MGFNGDNTVRLMGTVSGKVHGDDQEELEKEGNGVRRSREEPATLMVKLTSLRKDSLVPLWGKRKDPQPRCSES